MRCRGYIAIIIATGLWLGSTAFAQSRTHSYRLNKGLCESTSDNLRPVMPLAVQDYPNVNRGFLMKSATCATAKTCLFPERLNHLLAHGKLPLMESYSKFKKKMQDPACLSGSVFDERNNLEKASDYLNGGPWIPAPESEMLYEVTTQTKKSVEAYLQDSRAAMDILIKCFEIDQKYGDISPAEKIKKYNPGFDPADPKTHRQCDYIWHSESEFQALNKSLSDSRMALFLYQAYASDTVNSDKEIVDLVNDLKAGKTRAKERAAKVKMEPLKGKAFGILPTSSFWDGTPDKLEGLTQQEQEQLVEFKDKLVANKASGTSLQEAAAVKYFDIVSENPLIAYLDKANPRSQDFLKALKTHRGKQGKFPVELFHRDDMYLGSTSAIEAFLADQPPELVGDYCVLISTSITMQQNMVEALPKFLEYGMYGMMGGALVKGIDQAVSAYRAAAAANTDRSIKKSTGEVVMAVFMSGQKTGALYSAASFQKSYEKYAQMKKTCNSTYQTSNELCNVASLENAYNANAVNIALGMFFLAPPAAVTAWKKLKPGARLTDKAVDKAKTQDKK